MLQLFVRLDWIIGKPAVWIAITQQLFFESYHTVNGSCAYCY